MIDIIEIILAIIIVSLFIHFWSYVVALFSFIPTSLTIFVVLLISLNVILFIIGRK